MHDAPPMRSGERPSKVDATVAVALFASAGALAVAAALEAGLAALFAAFVLLRARRVFLAVGCAFVFFSCASRTSERVRAFEREHAQVAEGRWPSRCALVGEIASSPTRLGGAMRFDVEVAGAACDRSAPRGRVTVFAPLDGPDVARGDAVSVTASLAPPYRFANPDLGDPRPREARRRISSSGGADDVTLLVPAVSVAATIDRARAHVRRRILATFPATTSAMARALVLGEDDLAPDDRDAFRRSGLAHLLAVSGMHLVIVVAGFVAAVRRVLVFVPPLAARVDVGRVAAALGIPFAWIYADFAGSSGSAVRAACMMTVAFVAVAMARRPATWRALGLSSLVLLAIDPLWIFDLSFVLSITATVGILALAPPLAARLERWTFGVVAKALAATLSASIACAPVLALIAPELPLAGLVANLVAVPLGEILALPLCLAHVVLAPVPSAEAGAALAGGAALGLVRAVARLFAHGTTPVPFFTAAELAVFGAASFAFAASRSRRVLAVALVVVVALEVREHRLGAPRGSLRVTFLDVGQGDAALVDLPSGASLLVDAGGLVGSPVDVGERVVLPTLRARRRSFVDVVLLSHPHPDHYGGLATGTSRVRVGAMWDVGEAPAADVGHARLLASMRARGADVVGPARLCGVHDVGGARIEVLAPCPGPDPDASTNDNSLVVRISFGRRSVLFAGDAERGAEARLVAAGRDLHADVLKVGHHGSRTSSSPAWLAAVSPRVAVISSGVRNRFGHPHPATLLALARAGPRIYRTDRDGAVTVTTNGDDLTVDVR